MNDGNKQTGNPKKGVVEKLPEKKWDNPKDPRNAEDERDLEKVLRQKKEAERRKDNLTEEN